MNHVDCVKWTHVTKREVKQERREKHQELAFHSLKWKRIYSIKNSLEFDALHSQTFLRLGGLTLCLFTFFFFFFSCPETDEEVKDEEKVRSFVVD